MRYGRGKGLEGEDSGFKERFRDGNSRHTTASRTHNRHEVLADCTAAILGRSLFLWEASVAKNPAAGKPMKIIGNCRGW